jgi:farnesyl diphosphate synthase
MFATRLESTAGTVEDFLSCVLDETCGTPERLQSAMRHAVLGGGKRFRPFLVIECASLFGVLPTSAITTAAALECIHCYSLVHDDLPAMDNDTLRRGRPTVWKAFDDWTAILAGDALLTLAFELVARPEAHPDPAARSELALLLARASGRGGMVGGQCLDLEADKLGDPRAGDPNHIRRLQEMKTGALIRYACEAGAILGRASPADAEALKSFGGHLGFAFQIADDLLDTEGNAETVGKATGKDVAAGKATLVAHAGAAAARRELHRVHQLACAALEPFGRRAAILRAAADFAIDRSR